ncbi:22867_t:CDS:2 [Gigaspora margarita]|uniref:22867_t:CDS:1 n=1 Tax=Gigaspora margarita TaxID=4874 RepID=A0ABM8VWS0_GIGMA|nr:22867_t:CDS:2 [Gigaspora margarita]
MNEQEHIANPIYKKETSLKRQERMRQEYEAKLAAKNVEIEQILEKNNDLAQEKQAKEDQLLALRAANKALDKALFAERSKKEIGEYQAESEGQAISRMAVEILKKRCRAGRYGVKCQDMPSLEQSNNQEFLQELQNCLHNRQLSEKEVAKILEAEQ